MIFSCLNLNLLRQVKKLSVNHNSLENLLTQKEKCEVHFILFFINIQPIRLICCALDLPYSFIQNLDISNGKSLFDLFLLQNFYFVNIFQILLLYYNICFRIYFSFQAAIKHVKIAFSKCIHNPILRKILGTQKSKQSRIQFTRIVKN